ncbi:MAG: hypothetical protein JST92_00160 [Deltaproteobacteria bacterium]|nr:hypothetical protein [Deltaproteobacteria bacterium]
MSRLATVPLLCALALLSQGCPAYMLAGLSRGDNRTTVSVPESTRAPLLCNGVACSSVQVERNIHTGRSRGVWGVTTALEGAGGLAMFVAGTAGLANSVTISGGSSGGTGGSSGSGGAVLLAMGSLLLTFCSIDLLAGLVSDEFGDHTELAIPAMVTASWDGKPVMLNVSDVAPDGVHPLTSFSLAQAMSRRELVANGASTAPPAPQALLSPAAPFRAPSTPSQPPASQASAASSPRAAPAAPSAYGADFPSHSKVAILDFKNFTQDLNVENVRYFADVVRGATLRAVPRFDIMTRENLLVLLKASGKAAEDCEGECEVDTGRRIGADLVVTGDIQHIGTKLKLTLRLHETKDGRLLSTAIVSGKTIDDLDGATEAGVAELIQPLK